MTFNTDLSECFYERVYMTSLVRYMCDIRAYMDHFNNNLNILIKLFNLIVFLKKLFSTYKTYISGNNLKFTKIWTRTNISLSFEFFFDSFFFFCFLRTLLKFSIFFFLVKRCLSTINYRCMCSFTSQSQKDLHLLKTNAIKSSYLR